MLKATCLVHVWNDWFMVLVSYQIEGLLDAATAELGHQLREPAIATREYLTAGPRRDVGTQRELAFWVMLNHPV